MKEISFTIINKHDEMFVLKTTEKYLDEFFDNLNLSGEIKFTDQLALFEEEVIIDITDDSNEFIIGTMTCEGKHLNS